MKTLFKKILVLSFKTFLRVPLRQSSNGIIFLDINAYQRGVLKTQVKRHTHLITLWAARGQGGLPEHSGHTHRSSLKENTDLLTVFRKMNYFHPHLGVNNYIYLH